MRVSESPFVVQQVRQPLSRQIHNAPTHLGAVQQKGVNFLD